MKTATELKMELKQEKAWLKECETNVLLSKAEIEHLEACIRVAEEKEGKKETLKATFVTTEGTTTMDIEDAYYHYSLIGRVSDESETRAKGGLTHRKELDNAPIFKGFYAPMWDDGGLRYETPAVYDMLSR